MLSPNTDSIYTEADILEMQNTIASLDNEIYSIASRYRNGSLTYDQLRHETFKLSLAQWVKYHP